MHGPRFTIHLGITAISQGKVAVARSFNVAVLR